MTEPDKTAPADRPDPWFGPPGTGCDPNCGGCAAGCAVASQAPQAAAPSASELADAITARAGQADDREDGADWSRLELHRNLPCIALVTLVPLWGSPAAGWVAAALGNGSAASVVWRPAGAVLCVVVVAWLGANVLPGLVGAACRLAWSLLARSFQGARVFAASRRGWMLTRPPIWAAVCGVVLASGRAVVRTLAEA